MKNPTWMSTSELVWWVRKGNDRLERSKREAVARRVLGSRHGESYAVRLINTLCGGGR